MKKIAKEGDNVSKTHGLIFVSIITQFGICIFFDIQRIEIRLHTFRRRINARLAVIPCTRRRAAVKDLNDNLLVIGLVSDIVAGATFGLLAVWCYVCVWVREFV